MKNSTFFICTLLIIAFLPACSISRTTYSFEPEKLKQSYPEIWQKDAVLDLNKMPDENIVDLRIYGCEINFQPALNDVLKYNFSKIYNISKSNLNNSELVIVPEFVIDDIRKYKMKVDIFDKNSKQLVWNYIDSRSINYDDHLNDMANQFSGLIIDRNKCNSFLDQVGTLIINTAISNLNSSIYIEFKKK